jgi:HAD superfamily hydrolase (TIGR01662 family)
MPAALRQPRGILVDYGGTLVVEGGFDARAGTEALLARAAYKNPELTLDAVVARAEAISAELSDRRDEFGVEVPWPNVTRLIHDYFGTRFDAPMSELELVFWKASVTTHAMPGAKEMLDELARRGIPVGVVSNCSFGSHVLAYELAKYGVGDTLAFIIVSAEYSVRKPKPYLFEVAAARLGVAPHDIWFIGDRVDKDVTGAAAAGMTPILFDPSGQRADDAQLVSISSWGELRAHLDSAIASMSRPAPTHVREPS